MVAESIIGCLGDVLVVLLGPEEWRPRSGRLQVFPGSEIISSIGLLASRWDPSDAQGGCWNASTGSDWSRLKREPCWKAIGRYTGYLGRVKVSLSVPLHFLNLYSQVILQIFI